MTRYRMEFRKALVTFWAEVECDPGSRRLVGEEIARRLRAGLLAITEVPND